MYQAPSPEKQKQNYFFTQNQGMYGTVRRQQLLQRKHHFHNGVVHKERRQYGWEGQNFIEIYQWIEVKSVNMQRRGLSKFEKKAPTFLWTSPNINDKSRPP